VLNLKPEQGHTIAVIRHGKSDKRGIVKVPVGVVRTIDIYLEAPLFVGFKRGSHPTTTRVRDTLLERLVKLAGAKIGMDLSPHCLRASFITFTSEGRVQLSAIESANTCV
jgi:integrase